MLQVCRLWLHTGDSHSGAAARWTVLRGHRGWQPIQGAEARPQRWLPHGRHRIPGGPEGQRHEEQNENRGPRKYQSNLSVRLCFSQASGSELEILHHLHDSVYQQTQEWYQRLGSRTREQINKQYGTMPDKEEDIQVCSTKFSTCLMSVQTHRLLYFCMIGLYFCCNNLCLSSRPQPMVQPGAGGCCLSFSWTLHIKQMSFP